MDLSNNAPADANPLADRLVEQHGELRTRADELLAALDRVPASLDDASHEKAAVFVKQLRVHSKAVDGVRESEKRPYLDAGRTIDAWARQITDRLTDAAKSVEAKITAFLRAKADAERKAREDAERAAREEAARRAAEMSSDDDLTAAVAAEQQAAAAARAAVAPVADLARTHTSYGVTSSLRTEIAVTVTSKADACRALHAYLDDDAMAKAARAWLRANKAAAELVWDGRADPVPGLRIERNMMARVA